MPAPPVAVSGYLAALAPAPGRLMQRDFVAAPVFSAVTGSALRTLGVPTDAPLNNVILPPEGSEIVEET